MNLIKTSTRLALVAALAAVATAATAADEEATKLLRKADSFRSPSENMQLDVQITLEGKNGQADRERQYLVFAQASHNSLVLMRSPSEKGQKVLMLGDEFWIVMPGSARPMRITPMQKLLGDASAGDVSAMRWNDDYTADAAEQDEAEGIPATRLTLKANRKAVTYQRIELWVGREHGEPIKADLYVQSDKLAKSVLFELDSKTKPTRVTQMVMRDQLANDRRTIVRYSGQKQRTVPAQWLNPMFLATNPQLD